MEIASLSVEQTIADVSASRRIDHLISKSKKVRVRMDTFPKTVGPCNKPPLGLSASGSTKLRIGNQDPQPSSPSEPDTPIRSKPPPKGGAI